MGINWSAAPEGATHWAPQNEDWVGHWVKIEGAFIYTHTDFEWIRERGYLDDYILSFVRKPEQHVACAAAPSHPKQERYKHSDGDDYLDKFFARKTPEEVRGAMSFIIGKYDDRLGKKDDILSEVTKMADYSNRWMEYERKLLEEAGNETPNQNT